MSNREEVREAIAERLAIAREKAGLSQGQASKLMGMHRPTISEIEAGRRRVAAEEISQFANIYGVEISWLINAGSDEESDNRVSLAARELSELKPDDLQSVLDLLKTMKKAGDK